MKTTVEINGRKYDAKTGRVLNQPGGILATSAKAIGAKLKKPVSNGNNIDGIAHRPNHQAHQPIKSAVVSNKPSHPRTIAQPVHRTIEKSRTLLRTAVKKPLSIAGIHSTSGMINTQKTSTANSQPVIPTFTSRVGHSVKHVTQSSSISHFGEVTKNSFTKVVSSVGLASPPDNLEASPPLIFAKHGRGKHDKPQVFNHHVPKNNYQTSAKSASEKAAKRLSRRIKIKPKMAAICISVLAVLCFGGFLAYQNVPEIAIRVAIQSAGFNGRLPENIPAGYSFKGPIEFTKGYIALHYHSNSDARDFTITQKPTTWTSDSLLTNYIEARDLKYQTSVSDGLRVFVFNEGNATWIDKGVWFNITGEGSLSSDQILNIASSF